MVNSNQKPLNEIRVCDIWQIVSSRCLTILEAINNGITEISVQGLREAIKSLDQIDSVSKVSKLEMQWKVGISVYSFYKEDVCIRMRGSYSLKKWESRIQKFPKFSRKFSPKSQLTVIVKKVHSTAVVFTPFSKVLIFLSSFFLDFSTKLARFLRENTKLLIGPNWPKSPIRFLFEINLKYRQL